MIAALAGGASYIVVMAVWARRLYQGFRKDILDCWEPEDGDREEALAYFAVHREECCAAAMLEGLFWPVSMLVRLVVGAVTAEAGQRKR